MDASVGLLSAVLATAAFSVNAPLANAATKLGVSPTSLVAVRNLVALLILLPFADFKISALGLLVVIASALLGPGLGDAAYFNAISKSGVAVAVTIGYTYIFTAQFFSVLLGIEPLTNRVIVGAALAFSGVAVALGGVPRGSGAFYGLVASLAWGLASALLGVATKGASVYTIAVLRSAVLAPLFFALSGFKRPPLRGLIYAVSSGVVGLALGSAAFIYAISAIGVSKTVIATSLTPILSQIFDKALNKTPIRQRYILGATLVSLGIVISVMNN